MSAYERKNHHSVSEDIVWHNTAVSSQERAHHNQQSPAVLWFTGLSGSGKSTIANAVERMLFDMDKRSYLLDGDNVRHGLNRDLGFSDQDRVENIRRIGEVAKLFVDSGAIVLTAFISPFIADRQQARELMEEGRFFEVYIDTPLEVCEQRDPKGLYKKARSGEIANFTGIDSEYEKPVSPEIHIQTQGLSVEQCAKRVVDELARFNLLDIKG